MAPELTRAMKFKLEQAILREFKPDFDLSRIQIRYWVEDALRARWWVIEIGEGRAPDRATGLGMGRHRNQAVAARPGRARKGKEGKNRDQPHPSHR